MVGWTYVDSWILSIKGVKGDGEAEEEEEDTLLQETNLIPSIKSLEYQYILLFKHLLANIEK